MQTDKLQKGPASTAHLPKIHLARLPFSLIKANTTAQDTTNKNNLKREHTHSYKLMKNRIFTNTSSYSHPNIYNRERSGADPHQSAAAEVNCAMEWRTGSKETRTRHWLTCQQLKSRHCWTAVEYAKAPQTFQNWFWSVSLWQQPGKYQH